MDAQSTPPVSLRPGGAAVVLGLCLFTLTACTAFLVPHVHGMEEAGVFNAPYTYSTQGRMAFPIYGERFFDSFGIHPHTHYAVLGTLLRWGVSLHLAEALLSTAMVLLATLLVLRGPFPSHVQTGLLFGLYCTVVIAATYLPDHGFSVRPEMYLALVWLTGLVALEGAHLSGWPALRLLLGSFLLTYASGLQNFALLGFTGLLVYLGSIWWTAAGWWQRLSRTGLVAAGACLFGVPFLILYVYPNRDMIRDNIRWGRTHAAPLKEKIPVYLAVHDTLRPLLRRELPATVATAGPVVLGQRLRVPLFVLGAAGLLLFPSVRRLAVAALPVPFLIVWTLPKMHYFIAEILLFSCGFWCVVAWLWQRAGTVLRLGPALVQGTLVSSLVVLAWWGSPLLRTVPANPLLPVHEMDLARAAGKEIVGADALVASRHLAWYISGAARWQRLESDLTEPQTLPADDLTAYAAQFDALADYELFSAQTQSGHTPSTMYARRQVGLKGFFLSERLPGLSLLYFQAHPSGAVKGFFRAGETVYRFDENEAGDHVFVSYLTTVQAAHEQCRRLGPMALTSQPVMLSLPPQSGCASQVISVFVASRSALEGPRLGWLKSVAVLDQVVGTLTADALVRSHRPDPPIQFRRSGDQEMLKEFVATSTPIGPVSTDARKSPDQPCFAATIDSGPLYGTIVASNAFDGQENTCWASNHLGNAVRYRAYLGMDFGRASAIEVRRVSLCQGANLNSTLGSAIVAASDDGFSWRPVAVLAMPRDLEWHSYALPAAGRHRYWKLIANANPTDNHAWQIAELRLSER